MKKKLLAAVLAAAVFGSLPGFRVKAAGYDARSVLLMEAGTGRVLYEENADEALPPASVTKIMTLLLVMEAVDDGRLDWDETVCTSEYAASMGGSQVFLKPGEEMPVSEMVKCVVVASANDAAVALAEKVAGSEEAFVAKMNERAASLGMNNTVFKNTNGLDDAPEDAGHVTSARDIALMSRELIVKHPKILELSSIWMDTIRDGAFGLTNTNRLVRFYRGANGLKTGSTAKAGFCISATAERGGMQLIAVVMGAPSRDSRNDTAKKLLDYGFANWECARLTPEIPPAVRVLGGVAPEAALTAEETTVLLPRGKTGALKAEISLPEKISAPAAAGQTLGRADYYLDGEKIASIPLTLAENVEKVSFFGLFSRFLGRMTLSEMKY